MERRAPIITPSIRLRDTLLDTGWMLWCTDRDGRYVMVNPNHTVDFGRDLPIEVE